ncbi:MAG TPA: DUF1080 domain-containing protein, partial [Gemmatimonadales bacterium]|nr:DUF1080 domain-containing protein [Gemmatimonadales bacterium]
MNVWPRLGSALLAVLVAGGCSGMSGSAAPAAGASPAAGPTTTLFDGSSLDGWKHIGPGSFALEPGGSIVSEGGMGLLYYTPTRFRDFVLDLDYKTDSPGTNSGIFVRFPQQSDDPWYAVNNGYEIQIDDKADPIHATGSVYTFSPPSEQASRPAGEWNHYRIQVTGQHY